MNTSGRRKRTIQVERGTGQTKRRLSDCERSLGRAPAAARLQGAWTGTLQKGGRAACVPAAEPGGWGGMALGLRRHALRGGTWRAEGEPALFTGFKNNRLRAFPVQTSARAAAPHLRRDLGRGRAVASPRDCRTALLSRPWRAPSPALDPAESRRCQPPSCPLPVPAQRPREVPGQSFLLCRGLRNVSPRLAP